MLIRDAEFIAFDLETTGLDPDKGDKICELGAVRVTQGKISSSFNSLVNPRRIIPDEVVAIHGITQAQVEKAPYFEQVIDSFLEFTGGLPLFAYNIGFDLKFLKAETKLINKLLPQTPCVDILFICRNMLQGLPRYKLSYIADHFSISYKTTHRAEQDSCIAANIFLHLIPILAQKGINSLEHLYTIFGSDKDLSLKINNPKVRLIQDALEAKARLKIKYYSSSSELSERVVEPLRIENRGKNILLVGKCLLRGEERRFNLGRILTLEAA